MMMWINIQLLILHISSDYSIASFKCISIFTVLIFCYDSSDGSVIIQLVFSSIVVTNPYHKVHQIYAYRNIILVMTLCIQVLQIRAQVHLILFMLFKSQNYWILYSHFLVIITICLPYLLYSFVVNFLYKNVYFYQIRDTPYIWYLEYLYLWYLIFWKFSSIDCYFYWYISMSIIQCMCLSCRVIGKLSLVLLGFDYIRDLTICWNVFVCVCVCAV